jgi:hypothetical protein
LPDIVTLLAVTQPVARYTSSRFYSAFALIASGCALLAGWIALRWPAAAIAAGFFSTVAILFVALALRPAIEIHETHLVIGRAPIGRAPIGRGLIGRGLIGRGLIGRVSIPWAAIRRVDQLRWQPWWRVSGETSWGARWSSLAVYLTLDDESRVLVLYAGPLDSASSLLRQLRRYAREASIDGVPYRQFWGQAHLEPTRLEYIRPEHIPSESARLVNQRAQDDGTGRQDGAAPLAARKTPFLLAEDEAEIEQMFQRLKSVGRLDSRGDAPGDPRTSGEE